MHSVCFCVRHAEIIVSTRSATSRTRQGRKAGTPLHEVVLVDGKPRGRQVEVVFVEGGVRMFVHQARLVCLWSARKTFLRHEARFERLKEDWLEKYESAIDGAMNSVLTATGEATGHVDRLVRADIQAPTPMVASWTGGRAVES
jgi:hypothetical protein